MTRFLFTLVLAGCSLVAESADEQWFKLVESKSGGYVAGGKLHGSSWGFRLPGREIKQVGIAGGPPTFAVDGVILSLVPVMPEAYGRNAADLAVHPRRCEDAVDTARVALPLRL